MSTNQDQAILSFNEAHQLIETALRASRTSEHNAQSVASALVQAEMDGQKGHGFSRVPAYCGQAQSGKVNGFAKAKIKRAAPSILSVDACHGFAYPVFDQLIEDLPAIAESQGLVAASIFHSHHCGQAGFHVERLADKGLVALLVANTPKAIAPWGGQSGLFGTNPIAFATPVDGKAPLVIDLSLSKVARGKIMAASQRGEPIEEGLAFDKDGMPTTDASAALKGTMAAIGDAKGAALALMVEIMAAGLTGAKFSYEAGSFFTSDGEPPAVGQLLLAFDPVHFGGPAYTDRMAMLCETMLMQDGVRLPGQNKRAMREKAAAEGLSISAALLDQIRDLTQ